MRAFRLPIEKLIRDIVEELGGGRVITKKCYFADRHIELLSLKFGCNPDSISNTRKEFSLIPEAFQRGQTAELISYLIGVVANRYRTIDAKSFAARHEPSDKFPEVPPAIMSEILPGSGVIAVSDVDHPSHLAQAVTSVVTQIFGARSRDVFTDICEFLGVSSLDDYLDTPSCFFSHHLSTYSGSRRKAPIYWPLSTESGSYTVWVYYHRLTDQTLFSIVNDFVSPKLEEVESDLARVQESLRDGATAKDRDEFERLQSLRTELIAFREELLRIAHLPWKPNLNDGVQITAAPLWKLFRHKPWQKVLKDTWKKLEKGDYDWAHLALAIWPDRVVRASHQDRSYAIAHDLEDTLWEEVEVTDKKGNKKTEWRPRELEEDDFKELIERNSV